MWVANALAEAMGMARHAALLLAMNGLMTCFHVFSSDDCPSLGVAGSVLTQVHFKPFKPFHSNFACVDISWRHFFAVADITQETTEKTAKPRFFRSQLFSVSQFDR